MTLTEQDKKRIEQELHDITVSPLQMHWEGDFVSINNFIITGQIEDNMECFQYIKFINQLRIISNDNAVPNIVFSALLYAGSIDIKFKSTTNTLISFPVLEIVDHSIDIWMEYPGPHIEVSFPSLKSAGNIYVSSSGLNMVSFPQLTEAFTISLLGITNNANFAKLKLVDTLFLSHCNNIDFPSLESIKGVSSDVGDVGIRLKNACFNIKFSRLVSALSISLTEGTSSIKLDSLRQVKKVILVYENSEVSLPVLTSLPQFVRVAAQSILVLGRDIISLDELKNFDIRDYSTVVFPSDTYGYKLFNGIRDKEPKLIKIDNTSEVVIADID